MKIIRNILLTAFTLAIALFFLNKKVAKIENPGPYKYAISSGHRPDSFDPLDADNYNNLHMARMIYLAPLEALDNNQLRSHILERFAYDKDARTLTFIVKNGVFYSDNTPVTVEDVAFAVVRMAYTRPGFPVLKHVKGLEKWRKGANPLQSYPEGIRVDGRKIEIMFDWDVPSPFFRFCLELFSIIPKQCVDLATNKIICDEIPTNGPYSIAKKEDKAWTYVKNERLNIEGPKQIIFEFWEDEKNIVERLKTIDENTVVHSSDAFISDKQLKELQSEFNIRDLPRSRFVSVLMNPNSKPFQRPECRRIFATAIINAYSEIHEVLTEESIFSNIVKGHLSIEQLKKNSQKATDGDLKRCRGIFQKHPPRWASSEDIKQLEIKIGRFEYVKKAWSSLEIKAPEIKTLSNYDELKGAFVEGKIDFIFFASGFWPLDVGGDLQMLFTPGLHKLLYFVAKDAKFQAMIEKAVRNPNDTELYESINQYLYDNALMRAYAHSKRFYISKNRNLWSNLAIGITSPAPWQLFK